MPAAWGQIGINQYLLGDSSGNLLYIVLDTNKKGVVQGLRKIDLGKTSQATSITKLGVRPPVLYLQFRLSITPFIFIALVVIE